MAHKLFLRSVLVAGAIVVAACGGGGDEPAASEAAGRAVPTAIGDLQADCDRGAPGACEALEDRLGDGLSSDESQELLCAGWSDLQLLGPNASQAADRLIDTASDDLPAEVVTALETIAAGSGDDAEAALDTVDTHFESVC